MRLALTTISLNGQEDLLIESIGTNLDMLQIHVDGTNSQLVISDPGQILNTSISGANGSGTNVVQIPFSSFPNAKQLLVNTLDGDDFIRLTSDGISFSISPVIDGGNGFDVIESTAAVSVGTANVDVSWMAEDIRLGADITTAGGKVSLFGSVTITNDVNITTDGTTDGDVLISGPVESAAGPSQYTLISTPRIYNEAQVQAGRDVPGGHLVTIRSASEQTTVQGIAGNNDVWIGATDGEVEGDWIWEAGPDFGVRFWSGDGTTGSAVNREYSNWFLGEPDNLDGGKEADAAFLVGGDPAGRWRDGDRLVARPYLVESPTLYAMTINAATGAVNFSGSVGNFLPLKSLAVTAGQTQLFGGTIQTAESQTFNSAVTLSSGPALLRAEEIDFNGGVGSVTGTSGLTLAPIKVNAPINVGAMSDAGQASFDVTDTDLAAIAAGFATLLIGEPPPAAGGGQSEAGGFSVRSVGPVTITSSTFLNPVLIAGGSISVTQLDAGTNKVDLIAATGSITDGGDAGADITAGDLSLDSTTGIGSASDSLETTVAAIAARGAMSGGVFVANTGDLSIGSTQSQGGIFTNNGGVSVTSTGSITVLQPIFTNGGDVSLTAASGIAINGVPIDTAGGQFTADADSNNDGSGTFSISSLTDFVDWTTTSRGSFADGTSVDLFTTTLATATAQFNANDTRFSDGNIYSPAQASGDYVETRFSQPFEAVTFSFSNPQFGLFVHFDGMQYQGTPFDPGADNPINLYSFDRTPMKISGESTWDVDTATNSIRQLSGDHLADQDGTVGFQGGLSSLTLSRTASGVASGTDGIVNVQLGLFRPGFVMTVGGSLTIRAADVEINPNSFLNANSGLINLIPSGTDRTVDLGAAGGAGQFVLADAELDQISTTSGLVIGDTSTGNITINDAVTRPTATNLSLIVANDRSIEFRGANANLEANGGNVTLTTGGSGAILSGNATSDIRAAGVALTSGSGGIGASGNPLTTDASNLTATTNGNADSFLSEIDSLTIGSAGVSAGTGTITLASGTFRLGGSNRIDDNSTLDIASGATFQLNGLNDSLASLKGSGSVINGAATASTLTVNLSGNDTFSGVLGGAGANDNNFGLTKTGSGTLTLSGANTYTGATTILDGTLRYGAFSVLSDTTAVTVSAPGTLNLATFGDIVGSLAGDGTVTLGSAPLEVGTDNTSTTFSGTMNGTGQFIKNGTGTFTLSGTITAGGNVTINEGTFRLASANRIADGRFIAMGLTGIFNLNGFDETIGGLSGGTSNTVTLGGGTLTTGGLNIATSFFGAISGSGSLIKEGTEVFRLERSNSYTGSTTVNAGTLLINGSVTSNVTVASGATVGGSGTINSSNSLTVQSGGTIAPGTSPGILNSGNVTLQSGSAFNAELNGTTVGTQYDQLNVTGTVTIGSNVTLNGSLGFTPAAGDTFVIINNDGSDAISGTFNGLGQGALLTIGGEKFHIVYNHNSGDGNANDVALIANRLPVVNDQSFSIVESSSNGVTVGTVVASDADSAVTFAITGGNTGNVFAISASTGQITVNDANGLDFESAPTFNLTVEITDDAGVTDTAVVTINVTNAAPSTPVDGDAEANSVSEGAGIGDPVGIDADSADAHGGTVTFRLTDDAGGRFTINASTGVVQVANATLLNFENATSHTITVEASDGTNASTQDFTISVTNVAPNTPVDADVAADSVSEGAINGDSVGIDADSGDVHGGPITFSLTNDAGGRFTINSATGVVTVANASLLDFESATSHVITVQASDGTNSTTQDFTIAVTNVAPAAPIDGDAAPDVVSEGITNGDPVGIDADSSDVHGGTITFSLTDNAGGRFAIDSTTGIVTVAEVALLDFSAPTSHTIIVQASDGRGGSTQSFSINVVSGAPDVPTDVDAHVNTVPEGALAGSRVGITLFATDPQRDNVFYRLTDDAGGRFNIDPLTGVVMVKDGSLLRFADVMRHTIRAVAVDATGNASAEASFDVTVTQVPADALPLASILPARVSVVEGDFGPNFITFLVKLNKPSAETITIDFTTRTGDDRSFQRPEGIDDLTPFATDEPGPWDFFRSSGQLRFDPGVTEQPLRVQIRPDDRIEANEFFFVQLRSPVNVKLAPQQAVAIAQILDDDSVPQLLVENSRVLEGDTAGQNELVFTVRLVGNLAIGTTSATVDFATSNIAIDTALAGTDYTATSGTLTFNDSDRVREVRVPILGDLDDEAEETVSLRFENPIDLGLSRSEVIGTIINDDSPNVVVAIAPSVFKLREGNLGSEQIEFFVTLIGKPTGDVAVNYATADETAAAGSDYTAMSGTLNFTLADIAAGNVQQSIFVTIHGDTDVEPDETLTVTLSLPVGTLPEVSLALERAASRIVLRNDDQAILTEDGDALAVALTNELTTILGAGPKNNPALIAALRARAVQIIQTQGLDKAIVLIIDPVDFVLTDPEGRQAGYTEGTGVVNQIPGTYYSGDGTVELLIVPLPPDGTYNVQLAGLGGDFNASITVLDSNGTSTNIVSQALAEGATSSVSFQVGGNTTIPVGLGLAAKAATPSVGVVGDFGQREFGLALATAFEDAAANGLEFDGPDSPSTELAFWLTVSARIVRQRFFEPLWQSLGSPFGDWLSEGRLAPRSIPPEIVDQFWSQLGQTLTGVPSSVYRLGDMLENLIPALRANRNRSTPRAGEQGQPNPAPNPNAVRARRSSLERPRTTPPPQTPPAGQAQPSSKPNGTKDKSTQAPEPQKANDQQSRVPRTRWLWFTFKDESAAKPSVPTKSANHS